MKHKFNKGDWVFIKGSYQIRQDYFDKNYPRGHFGKIIEIIVRYNRLTGDKLMDKVIVRVYRPNGEKWHNKTTYKYLQLA